MRNALVPAALAAVLLAGCATSQPATSPAPAATAAAPAMPAPAAVPTPLPDDDLNATLWTQRAVEHDLVLREIYRAAGEKLATALADASWDALPQGEREAPAASLPPAIIVDVDEAVLDNSPYQARLIRSGEEYNEFTWSVWCKEEKAKPLAGAVEFLQAAAAEGVTVFYLTNRAVDLGSATLANLKKDGFPLRDDGVFLGLGTVVKGCEMYGSDKGCRRRLIGREYRVLMQFGDQVGDFVDVVAKTLDGRAQAMAPYSGWLGERWWVLPNPTYGSWEPACFNNVWAQPRGKRRAQKIDKLITD